MLAYYPKPILNSRSMFSHNLFIQAKKSLYVSLIRFQLLYCSQLCHPYLLQDIAVLEQLQRLSNLMIINLTIYKTCLIKLHMLSLMYYYDLSDILFFIKSVKSIPLQSLQHQQVCPFL